MAEGNRTDLNTELANTSVGTGDDREWGARQADEQAQEAVPMAGPRQPPTLPGAMGPLNRPTEMPDQPITAGLPSGPGPGPEALLLADGAVMKRRQYRARQYAEQLARLTGSPELKRILDGGR